MEKLFTVKEIVDQKLLGYKERTIRNLIKSKQIRVIDVSHSGSKKPSYRIPESAIKEFIQGK